MIHANACAKLRRHRVHFHILMWKSTIDCMQIANYVPVSNNHRVQSRINWLHWIMNTCCELTSMIDRLISFHFIWIGVAIQRRFQSRAKRTKDETVCTDAVKTDVLCNKSDSSINRNRKKAVSVSTTIQNRVCECVRTVRMLVSLGVQVNPHVNTKHLFIFGLIANYEMRSYN